MFIIVNIYIFFISGLSAAQWELPTGGLPRKKLKIYNYSLDTVNRVHWGPQHHVKLVHTIKQNNTNEAIITFDSTYNIQSAPLHHTLHYNCYVRGYLIQLEVECGQLYLLSWQSILFQAWGKYLPEKWTHNAIAPADMTFTSCSLIFTHVSSGLPGHVRYYIH